jgi:hypothetical protein
MPSTAEPAIGVPTKRTGGPQTAEGKESVKYNALKHGLRAKSVVLPHEDEAEFNKLRDCLFADIRPQGAMERVLAEEIVVSYWRMQRVRHIERELLTWQIDNELKSDSDAKDALARAAHYGFGPSNTMRNLKSYETAIKREFMSFFHELQRLQAARLTGKQTAPLAIDIDISGGLPERLESGSLGQPGWAGSTQTSESGSAYLAQAQLPPAVSGVAPRRYERTLAAGLGQSGGLQRNPGKEAAGVGQPGGLKLRDFLAPAQIQALRRPKSYAFTFRL